MRMKCGYIQSFLKRRKCRAGTSELENVSKELNVYLCNKNGSKRDSEVVGLLLGYA